MSKDWMIKKGNPHIIAYNPNFENDSDYMILPSDFDVVGYQEHMLTTRGKPTKTVRAFFEDAKQTPMPETTDWNEFRVKETPENELADGLKEELDIFEEPVVMEEIPVIPEIKETNPSPRDLALMKKSELVEICSELGIDVDEDMLKRNMIINVKEFLEDKKKTNDLEKTDDSEFPNV